MSNKRKELRRKYTVDSNRDHRLPAGREEDESSGDAVATRASAVPSEEGAERACREKEADDPVQDLLYGHLIETTKYRRDHVKKFTPYRDIHKEPIIIASGLNTVLDAAGIQAPEDVRRRMVNLIHHGLLAGPTRADPAVIQRVSWKLGGAGPFSHRLGQEVAQAVI